jgi:hypothetical protein
VRIKQNYFSGERPRVASHISKDYEAQIAENCDLSRGDLRPLKNNSRIQNLTQVGNLGALYHWKKSGTDEWIIHENELDFARSPIAGEAHDRVYVTGMPEPRVLTTSILSTPFDFETDYYKLGVPPPAVAPTIDAGYVGGSDYRAYIYTYVVKLGTTDAEEGSNSPIAEISDYGSGDVILSNFTTPPTDRAIGKIRIYRTASSTGGVAEFLFVGEFDIATFNFATDTFTDDVADADLGEAFTCEDWVLPPTGLSGIIAPDGGSLAGFYGNRVYVTEPYLPHAWPYSYPVDSTIIGLGFIKGTIVVVTDEFIYLLSGQADAMSTEKLSGKYPCLAKAGIVSSEVGVFFPSHEGIVLVTTDGPVLFSYDFFTKLQYYNSYTPTVIRAIYYNGKYFAFHNNGCFMIDARDKTLSRIATSPFVSSPHVSLVDNELYFISRDEEGGVNALYKFADPASEEYLQYTYRSKDFILGSISNFSAARVIRDITEWGADNAANIAANAAIFAAGTGGAVNDEEVNAGAVNFDNLQRVYTGITFRLYGDGVLLHSEAINDDNPFRLPGEVTYQRCFFELAGDIPVDDVTIATSMEELLDVAA